MSFNFEYRCNFKLTRDKCSMNLCIGFICSLRKINVHGRVNGRGQTTIHFSKIQPSKTKFFVHREIDSSFHDLMPILNSEHTNFRKFPFHSSIHSVLPTCQLLRFPPNRFLLVQPASYWADGSWIRHNAKHQNHRNSPLHRHLPRRSLRLCGKNNSPDTSSTLDQRV